MAEPHAVHQLERPSESQLVPLVKKKVWQAVYLQTAALITVVILIWSERRNPALEGLSVFGLPGPLWTIIGITGAVLFVTLVAVICLFSAVLKPGKEDAWVVRWANFGILGVAIMDLLGIAGFVIAYHGAVGFLPLTTTLVATMVVFTCQHSGPADPCRVCRWAAATHTRWSKAHRAFWVWLGSGVVLLGGRCHGLAVLGLLVYLGALWWAPSVVAFAQHRWIADYIAPKGPISLRPTTMVSFAVLGLGQFLYAKFAREVATV